MYSSNIKGKQAEIKQFKTMKKDTVKSMTVAKANQEGVKAFNKGKESAPALNNRFIKEACDSDTDLNELLEAYTHGWHIANLASNCTDLTMPSLIELDRINKAA